MKTSAVLASLLFGSFAVAAPVDKRALVYKTEVVTETVVVYTTVFDDDEPVAQATTTPAGYFYEAPKAPSSAAAKPTPAAQAPANSPVAESKPSSTYVAPAPVAPAPTPSAPAPVVEQPKPVVETPAPVVETPKPVDTPKPATSPAYVAPAPAPSSAAPVAPAPSAPASGSPSSGETFSNVDMTIYDNNGGFGACGTALHDTDMIVALAAPAWGASTYDVMTGAATNPWCGQKIKVEYNGNSIEATIMDLCPGCSGHDIDLSLSAWKKLTGLDEKTRLKASWSKIG
jgi:outer membrane biosynthesis protein TonB